MSHYFIPLEDSMFGDTHFCKWCRLRIVDDNTDDFLARPILYRASVAHRRVPSINSRHLPQCTGIRFTQPEAKE